MYLLCCSLRSGCFSFSAALLAIAGEFHCELVGGDTTQGPLTITLQVHGFVETGKALTRDQAEVGDRVFVTGNLGDGRAALEVFKPETVCSVATEQYLQQRFYRPQPQIQAGRQLVSLAHACIDISDGLLQDLQHIATASAVDIEIDIDTLPISVACHAVGGAQAWEFALNGGDDYQLAFTIAQNLVELMQEAMAHNKIQVTHIGQAVKASGKQAQVRCSRAGDWLDVSNHSGFQHFAS